MAQDTKSNQQCIIGNPKCEYIFSSSKTCFIARPSDDDYQTEEDLLTLILRERRYETYVALQQSDPGRFAFCTKICSKIITSHFCIALLNSSKHAENASVLIPNPNVHLEYGMMMGFHKHIIPMQKETETLSFNIYPIDTVKYNLTNFKKKAEEAIDEILMRFETKEPPGQNTPNSILRYYNMKDMRYSDVTGTIGLVYSLGSPYGFNLFNSSDKYVFFGYFHQTDIRDILLGTKYLLKNIQKAQSKAPSELTNFFEMLHIDILVPEDSPIEKMSAKIKEFQSPDAQTPVTLLRESDIEKSLQEEYKSLEL